MLIIVNEETWSSLLWLSNIHYILEELSLSTWQYITHLNWWLYWFLIHNLYFSCCLYIYVRLSQHVLSAEDAGSFLSTTFGSCLVQAKRNYDNFMSLQVSSINECKVAKRKCGILPFVVNFEVIYISFFIDFSI